MRATIALICVVVLAGAPRAQSVWMADDQCTTADFTSVQDAIDAAADGDVIVVRNGAGAEPIQLAGRSLTLVGNAGYVGVAPPLGDDDLGVTVRGAASTQTVVLRGFQMQRLRVLDCAGPVWIEDCFVEPDAGAHHPIRVRDSDQVVMQHCRSEAADWEGTNRHGMLVEGSRVMTASSQFFGSTPGSVHGPTLQGASGVQVQGDSFVLLDNGGVGGGNGGGNQTCNEPANGGAGLYLRDPQSHAWAISTHISGGGPGACPGSQYGDDVGGAGADNLVLLGGTGHSLTAPGLVIAGAPIELSVFAPFTQHTVLLVGLGAAPMTTPTALGAVLPGLARSFVVDLGALIGSLPAVVPSALAPVGVPLQLVLQPISLTDEGELRAGAGTWITVVEPALAGQFSCSTTVWVDDDAPGDPAPFDPDASDPLEDGTSAHPFDSLSEAVASAFPGSEIVLRDGTYGAATLWNPDISIRSADGPEGCFAGPIFATTSADRFAISGLTITGPNEALRVNADQAVIEDCVLTGGKLGLSLAGEGALVSGCILEGNTNGASLGGDVSMTACVFRDNTFRGIQSSASTLELVDCRIVDNGRGALQVNHGENITLSGCELLRNGSEVATGATIQVVGTSTALTVLNTIVADNVNQVDSALTSPGPVVARHSTFMNNGNDFPTLQFVGTEDVDVTLSHSIVWGPTVPVHAASRVTVDHCLVENGVDGFSEVWPVEIVGPLLSMPPGFVHTPSGNFHLGPSSPCVDAGDPAFVVPPGEKDFEGNPRLMGPAVDIGADERAQ